MRFAPSTRATDSVPASSPLTNRRAVAGCATVDVTSARDLDRLAEPAGRRRRQPLDEDLVRGRRAR